MQVLFCDNLWRIRVEPQIALENYIKLNMNHITAILIVGKLVIFILYFRAFDLRRNIGFLIIALALPQYCPMLMCEQEENLIKDRNT